MNYLYCLAVFTTFYIFFTLKILKNDILSPAFVSGISLWIATICVIFNEKKWLVTFSQKTFLIVAIGLITMLIAEIVAIKLPKIRVYRSKSNDYLKGPKLKKTGIATGEKYSPIELGFEKTLLLVVLNTVLFLIFYRSVVGSFSLDLSNIFASGGIWRKDDVGFDGVEMNPVVLQSFRYIIACTVVYGLIFLYNLIICKRKSRLELSVFIYFTIIEVIESLLSASRRSMLIVLCAYFFMAVFFWYIKNDWKIKIPFKILINTMIIIIIFCVVARASHSLVKGRESNLQSITDYITYYIGGSLQTLNLVLKKYPNLLSNQAFGQNTMGSILRPLHLMPSNAEPYTEMLYLGGNAEASSNTYTTFLLPIFDFGYVGGMIEIFILYFLYSRFYHKHIKFQNINNRLLLKIAVYAFTFWGVVMAYYCYPAGYIIAPTGALSLVCFIILFYYVFKVKM